jgi:hypothetical protein
MLNVPARCTKPLGLGPEAAGGWAVRGSTAFVPGILADLGRHGVAAVWSVIVDSSDVSRWFAEYLDAFAACGRGERDPASLLAYYGVPLLLTTDDRVLALTSDDQVVAVAQQQVDGMRAADYHRSAVLDSEVTVLNATSALYRGSFSRRRGDGGEIGRLTATYLVTDGPVGRRISALVVHSP